MLALGAVSCVAGEAWDLREERNDSRSDRRRDMTGFLVTVWRRDGVAER